MHKKSQTENSKESFPVPSSSQDNSENTFQSLTKRYSIVFLIITKNSYTFHQNRNSLIPK